MTRHFSTPLLVLAVAAVGGLNWFVGGSVAQEERANQLHFATKAPAMNGANFDITRNVLGNAEIDLVVAEVRPSDNGTFHLVVSNPSGEERTLKLRVEAWQRTGEMMARMVPPPELVWHEEIEVRIPAGGTLEEALSYTTTPVSNEVEGHLAEAIPVETPMAFSSISFALVAVNGDGA